VIHLCFLSQNFTRFIRHSPSSKINEEEKETEKVLDGREGWKRPGLGSKDNKSERMTWRAKKTKGKRTRKRKGSKGGK
jgi:hypothetical protein